MCPQGFDPRSMPAAYIENVIDGNRCYVWKAPKIQVDMTLTPNKFLRADEVHYQKEVEVEVEVKKKVQSTLLRWQLCVLAVHTEVVENSYPVMLHLETVRHPTCGELGTPEFFDDRTAGLGHTLRAGRPLVGRLSFHCVSGLWMNSLAHRPTGGIQGRAMRRRPMQSWVSCSGWSDNCL